MSHNHRRRRGAVIIAALVCLLIVMALLTAMLQGALRARRQLPIQRDLRQCELLLTAGLDRATRRLASESEYRGETWSLPADATVGLADGQVTITASRPAADHHWQISATAEYPLGIPHSIRRTHSITIPSPSTHIQE